MAAQNSCGSADSPPYPFPFPYPTTSSSSSRCKTCGYPWPALVDPAPNPPSLPSSSSPSHHSKAKCPIVHNLTHGLVYFSLVTSLVLLWWRTEDPWSVAALTLLLLHTLLVHLMVIVDCFKPRKQR